MPTSNTSGFCRRCGGPNSITGQLCDACEDEATSETRCPSQRIDDLTAAAAGAYADGEDLYGDELLREATLYVRCAPGTCSRCDGLANARARLEVLDAANAAIESQLAVVPDGAVIAVAADRCVLGRWARGTIEGRLQTRSEGLRTVAGNHAALRESAMTSIRAITFAGALVYAAPATHRPDVAALVAAFAMPEC